MGIGLNQLDEASVFQSRLATFLITCSCIVRLSLAPSVCFFLHFCCQQNNGLSPAFDGSSDRVQLLVSFSMSSFV